MGNSQQKQDNCTGMNATEASSSFVVPIAADHPIHNSLRDGPQEPERPVAVVWMEEETCSVGLDDGLVGENFIDEVRMAYVEECREVRIL